MDILIWDLIWDNKTSTWFFIFCFLNKYTAALSLIKVIMGYIDFCVTSSLFIIFDILVVGVQGTAIHNPI